MKKTLIVTDFSAASKHAALYSCALAEKMGIAEVLLYHSTAEPDPEGMVMVDDLLIPLAADPSEVARYAADELSSLASELKQFLPDGVLVRTLADSLAFINGVRAVVEKENIDLVVAGLYGSHHTQKNIVGKHTLSLTREDGFALLLVPESAKVTNVSSVMFACDLRYVSSKTPFDKIRDFLGHFGAPIHIVNVDYEETQLATDLVVTETMLHDNFKNHDAHFHYLRDKDIVSSLMEAVKQHHIDIIIAVPRKLGFFQQLFHESATKKIAINSTIPILILHNTK